ncbi:MAG: Na+/H+ antiporter subunit C [Sulfurimonas sp.]|jgi:multicomponent K+:H+ antiporter subunit C|nr:Na+/H+ antiporter subunit C [Sulfurimonas sp.]
MELLLALIIATLTGTGIFLTLRARTYPVVLGLTLLSYAANLFLFAMGRLSINQPPIYNEHITHYTDPLPQALVLTAIVISFSMSAFVIILSLKAKAQLGNDHVDGKEREQKGFK